MTSVREFSMIRSSSNGKSLFLVKISAVPKVYGRCGAQTVRTTAYHGLSLELSRGLVLVSLESIIPWQTKNCISHKRISEDPFIPLVLDEKMGMIDRFCVHPLPIRVQ